MKFIDVPAYSASQFEPFDTKTAVIKAGLVRLFRDCNIQMEFFQRPGVSLYNQSMLSFILFKLK
jgi:hypothetical protein